MHKRLTLCCTCTRRVIKAYKTIGTLFNSTGPYRNNWLSVKQEIYEQECGLPQLPNPRGFQHQYERKDQFVT